MVLVSTSDHVTLPDVDLTVTLEHLIRGDDRWILPDDRDLAVCATSEKHGNSCQRWTKAVVELSCNSPEFNSLIERRDRLL